MFKNEPKNAIQKLVQTMNGVPYKGWIGDFLIYIILFLFVVALVLAVFRTVSGTAIGILTNNSSGTAIIPNGSITYHRVIAVGSAYKTIDDLMPLLIIGGCIVILFLGALLKVNPVNFGIGLLALFVILLPISFLMSNIWHGILTQPAIISGASQDTNTNYLVAEMPVIVGIFGGLYIVVILAKYYRNGGWDED